MQKRAVFDKTKERKPLQHNCIIFAQFWEHRLIFEPWNPDIQESWNPLDFEWFGQFQCIRYFSHSVFVKELDFQYEIPIFHHSWNLPGITWNSGMPLELAIFLPNLAYSCGISLTYGYLTLFQLGWAVFGPSVQKQFYGWRHQNS